MSDYATRASEKLRRENQYCRVVSVFARTNPFRLQDQQYSNILSCKLNLPTNDTRDILHATKMLSRRVYKKGYNFIKAGVMLSDIYDKGVYQSDFFIPDSKRPKSEKLMRLIELIEQNLNAKAKIKYHPMQPGDMKETFADISKSIEMLDYNPATSLDLGIKRFVNWYLEKNKKGLYI